MKTFVRLIAIPIFLVIISIAATGCKKQTTGDVRIELNALDGQDPSSSNALFPTFVSEDEVLQKKLDKLNKEVETILEYYEERTEKGKGFIVHTYVSEIQSVPQCTILWYEEHSLLGDDYNLMTLAYNKITGEPMTSKEAVSSLSIDSVTLSTDIGKRFLELSPSLELKEMEIQGFETDESGTVTRIFVKLRAEKKIFDEMTGVEDTVDETHFYYYDLAEEKLRPLSEAGYEMPQ